MYFPKKLKTKSQIDLKIKVGKKKSNYRPLKTPNPEGFGVTPKTRQDLLISLKKRIFLKKILFSTYRGPDPLKGEL